MTWVLWGILLFCQAFVFTFVSRARNSSDIWRHLIACNLSNGVWYVSQLFMFKENLAFMTGAHGADAAVITGIFYTACTSLGAFTSHHWALRTEKGKAAVGSSKKYAQITNEEWEKFKASAAEAKEMLDRQKGRSVSFRVNEHQLTFRDGLFVGEGWRGDSSAYYFGRDDTKVERIGAPTK